MNYSLKKLVQVKKHTQLKMFITDMKYKKRLLWGNDENTVSMYSSTYFTTKRRNLHKSVSRLRFTVYQDFQQTIVKQTYFTNIKPWETPFEAQFNPMCFTAVAGTFSNILATVDLIVKLANYCTNLAPFCCSFLLVILLILRFSCVARYGFYFAFHIFSRNTSTGYSAHQFLSNTCNAVYKYFQT